MWASSEEPPGTMEADPPESMANLKDTCDQKTQLETVKDIMLKKKQTLKKKEEELQKYAKKLSKFKTRAKKSRSNKDDDASSVETTPVSVSETSIVEPLDDVDDISQATTPKAKSSLLQKKLAEDRKIFQQRSKELIESKRAVEEKVEALKQQFEEKYVTPVSIVSPLSVVSQTHLPITELGHMQDKDNRIAELSNRLIELEAVIIDLQDNLKEKDSVIDAKTKAITLMTADLSKKGKTALDSLEDTKDEMRSMQENFLLVETSLRNKNDILLKQLEEKSENISSLEQTVHSLTDELEAQKQAETVNADFSRSTMDTLVDTKDEMKSMQENFILIESSLKTKNEHLLEQLGERELKLAEAEAKIRNLETGMGIERQPSAEELTCKIEKLEEANRVLEDEKYELQKNVAELQDKIISGECREEASIEKDNRIAELEATIEEMKVSWERMEETKADLDERIVGLSGRKAELEKQVLDLESERQELLTKAALVAEASEIQAPNQKDDQKRVEKLRKELDDMNKSMIKMKLEHKNKLKSMSKKINNFTKVSDANAELVKLGNQLALLEEEKGNLQLSLVDFDEIKASAGDWQKRISDLEGKVSTQAKEIKAHIEAIAILENQKLDLVQELHEARQEVSSLEAENAESENLRVSAEMKVVDLEEELESSQRRRSAEPLDDTERGQLQRQIEALAQENERLVQKIGKHEELKGSSEVGSTDSFVKTGSNVDSTESFEALAADADRTELLKRIDGLTRENGALLEKLTRHEEKGSSDTGSTESFERIPEAGEEPSSKHDNLARENYELAAKVTRLEGMLAAAVAAAGSALPPAEAGARHEALSLSREPMAEDTKLTGGEAEPPIPIMPADVAAFADSLSTDVWGSEDLQQSIEEPRTSRTLAEDQGSASVAALERQVEECEAVIRDQKVTIDELRSKLEGWESEVVAGLREGLESKEKELGAALASRDKLREELAALGGHERAAEENLITTRQNLLDLGKKLNVYADEQKQLVDRLAERQALVEELETRLELEGKLLRERLEEEERKVADLLVDKRGQEEARGSAERQLQELEAQHEENLRHASSVNEELRHAYKSLELLKLKHTEDMDMLNRRLEDVMEELQSRVKENASLENELQEAEKSAALQRAALEEVKASLEGQLQELKETAQTRLEKLQTCAAVAKKKAALCEQLKEKYSELEEKWNWEMSEKEARDTELRESVYNGQMKDNKIADLEEELERLVAERSQAFIAVEDVKAELALARAKENELELLRKELEDLVAVKAEATKEADLVKEQLTMARENEKVVVAEMEMRLEQLRVSKDEILEELSASNARLIAIPEKDKEIADLRAALTRSETDRDEALTELNEAKEKDNRIVSLEAELSSLAAERQEILLEIDRVRRELDDARGENGKIPDLMAKLEAVDQELEKLRVERDEALLLVNENANEIARLDQELSRMNETGQESSKEIERLRAELQEATEKDKTIADLRTEVGRLQSARDAALDEIEVSRARLVEAQAKDVTIQELKEELKRSGASRARAAEELEAVRVELSEATDRLNLLSEAKDKARELGVRMEVMEAEYLEQLSQINSLRAENGMLLSKQAQVNERLENTEKESEDRRVKLEMLEKQRLMEESRRTEATVDPTCGHCTSRLHALEEMLQERDAEIENLDNELHNSIGDLLLMQERLGLSTVPTSVGGNASAQGSYEELARRFNVMTIRAEEMRIKYEEALGHNEDLLSRVAHLQDFNASLQSRLDMVEVELVNRTKKQERETSALAQGLEQSRSSGEESIVEDEWALEATTSSVNASRESSQQENGARAEPPVEREKRDAPSLPLFDGSIFGPQPSEHESTTELQRMNKELEELRGELEAIRSENEELSAAQEVYKGRLNAAEAKLATDGSARIAELEGRVSHVVRERDILQLQMTDVTRSYEEHREASESERRSLQEKLDGSARVRDQLAKELEELRSLGTSASVVPPTLEAEQLVAPESMWEDEEDVWGQDEKGASSEQHVDIPVIPSETIRLQVRVDELEEQLSRSAVEREKLVEESKNLQLKNAKCVKKLKEYKVQLESLQQQLRSQRSMDGLGADLDSAIEEELKGQIGALEKALAETRDELKKSVADKDGLAKRIDVLTAATERFTDTKEKQDTELHIWQKRYKDLELKLQQQQQQQQQQQKEKEEDEDTVAPETTEASKTGSGSGPTLAPDYEKELKELRDSVDALATENEELQQLLNEHRAKRQSSSLEDLQARNADLTASNDKLASDYNSLRKQYEQSLMDANDQVQSMRQNSDILKEELERLGTELQASVEARDLLEADVARSRKLSDELTEQVETKHANRETEMELEAVKRNLKRMQLLVDDYVTELGEKAVELRELRYRVSGEEVTLAEERLATLDAEILRCEIKLREGEEEARVERQTANGQGDGDGQAAVLEEKELRLAELDSQFQALTHDRRNAERELARKLEDAERRVKELEVIVAERDTCLMHLEKAEAKLESLSLERQGQRECENARDANSRDSEIPVFTFPGNEADEDELRRLRLELASKNEEVEQLQDWINKNSLTHLVQDMQDNINVLYNDKTALEQQLNVKDLELEALKLQVEDLQQQQQQQEQQQQQQQQQELGKRSVDEQEESSRLAKLEDELESRNRELLELREIVSDKESRLGAALERSTGDTDVFGVQAALNEKQQQLESLKFTIAELQSEVAGLRGREGLLAEERAAVDRLVAEKELARRDAIEATQRAHELEEEKAQLTEVLRLRDHDLETLRLRMDETDGDMEVRLDQRTEEVARLVAELSERDRRLAELSITKDTELHNMRVQLSERSARFEELEAMNDEEDKQLEELRKLLDAKEFQINGLNAQVAEKTKELELIQHALQRHGHATQQQQQPEPELQYRQQSELQSERRSSESGEIVPAESSEGKSADELDLALYMLHQRDVRCEELTHELMQLLEERDTLQLRLSNAIRVNEDLRKYGLAALENSSPKRNVSPTEMMPGQRAEPLVPEGPIEIAREAINTSIGEDKQALAHKLSQLKSVDQGRDVRLRDDRETRHAQQMSLLAHGDVLSTLPPEDAVKLVNANYTLSRDVQSQSSVLMNWLWGKSTPKIVHM